MITETGIDIGKAADFLRRGAVIAIPTETVYGLAGNALDENVVLNIFKLKNRPSFDPLIVHVGNPEIINRFVVEVSDVAKKLIEKFWPGPLTILFRKQHLIPDLVTSGLDTVALRMPAHPLTLELLRAIDFPLAAPSANPFGYISPTSAHHVEEHFSGKIPFILDGGNCKVGIESTIIGFEDDECVVYRLGGIALDELEKHVGKVRVQINSSSDPRAPGMLKSHYAPSKPLYFGELDSLKQYFSDKEIALICLKKINQIYSPNINVIELSSSGNLDEAATKLFSVMRELDHSATEIILAEKFPDKGLGKAINDRLQRASSQE